MSVFQRLYDSEINFTVSTFWDGGFTVQLGDELNGFVWEKTVRRFSDIAEPLREAALEYFPESSFAKMHTLDSFSSSRGDPRCEQAED